MQTWVAQQFAEYLSDKWNADVSVKRIKLEFIKTLVLEELLVKDHHSDTLLYAGKLEADLIDYSLEKRQLCFNRLALSNTDFYLQRYPGENYLNLQFIVDYFASKDTTAKKKWFFSCKQVELDDVHFKYIDHHATDTVDHGINFKDLEVSNLTLNIADFVMEEDTINCMINKLTLSEKSGFCLRQLTGNVTVNPVMIRMEELELRADTTHLAGDVELTYHDYSDFKDFLNEVRMNATLKTAEVGVSDIAYFVRQLHGIDQRVTLSGTVKGTVSQLRGKEIDLKFGPNSFFKGNFDLTGLPQIEETFIMLNVKEIATNKQDLESIPIPPFTEGKTFEVPAQLGMLGNMRFSGDFTGFVNDFVAYGTLISALGQVSSDINVFEDSLTKKLNYDGKLATNAFQLGQLFNEPMVGRISCNLKVTGSGITKHDLRADLAGSVQAIEYNNYNYEQIELEGSIRNKIFNGNLSIEDQNLSMDFGGVVDFAGALPVFEFESQVRRANLTKLKLSKRDSTSSFSTGLVINIVGNSIDNIQGNVTTSKLRYVEGKHEVKIDNFELVALGDEMRRSLYMECDYGEGELIGKFNYKDFPQAIKYLFSQIVPSYFPEEVKEPEIEQNFSYQFILQNMDEVTEIFLPGINLKEGLILDGDFNSKGRKFTLNLMTFLMEFNDKTVEGVNLHLVSKNDALEVSGTISQFGVTDSLSIDNIDISSKIVSDNIQFSLVWNNSDTVKYSGSLSGLCRIKDKDKFTVNLLNSQIVLADSVWKISNRNEINIDTTSIAIADMIITSKDHTLTINGKLSEHSGDKLNINLDDFSLSNLNLFTKGFGLRFQGTVSGIASVANPYKEMVFDSKIEVEDLVVNNELIGDGKLAAEYSKRTEAVELSGVFHRESMKSFNVKGSYFPKKDKNNLQLEVDFSEIQLAIFEPFVRKALSEFEGTARGSLNITGTPQNPIVRGELNLKQTNLFVNYLNTGFTIEDEVFFIEDDLIGFDNITVKDKNGKEAIATGSIYHTNYSDFNFDVVIEAKDIQCLNTTDKDNSLYYGQAFITGLVNVSGYADNLIIEITAKTGKGTEFFIPLGGSEDINESDYITFVNNNAELTVEKRYEVDMSGIQLSFDLEVTPDAEVQLIFDETVGDIMRARGAGNLKMEINTLGNFSIYGEYTVEEGDYLFTLQNIINKKFEVKKGGTITWSGNPYDAELDLLAMYNVRAPLYDILRDTAFKKRVLVECHLHMTDKIMNPSIAFDLELPSVDEKTRSDVLSAITTEEEMNKQVFTLLLINRFKAPDNRNDEANRAGFGSSTSSELLSNQLTNWLSQISDEFDIGVNYRPGDEISSKELDVALSTQLFNDRVTLEGNVGVAGNSQTNSNNIVGDFTLEYKITDDGKLRAKVFNESNDQNLLNANNARYTQGAGLFFREEFDTFGEFFRNMIHKKSSKHKKAD